MTALIGFFNRQLERTTASPRRLGLIIVLLAGIAMAGIVLLVQRAPESIKYNRRYVTATPAAVCPGETFTYPVALAVERGDSVSRVTEGWCRVSDGICPKLLQAEPYYVNFVDPYGVSTTATRAVPPDLAPGEWQLRHCNETHADGTIDVVCYQVALTVKDCQVQP